MIFPCCRPAAGLPHSLFRFITAQKIRADIISAPPKSRTFAFSALSFCLRDRQKTGRNVSPCLLCYTFGAHFLRLSRVCRLHAAGYIITHLAVDGNHIQKKSGIAAAFFPMLIRPDRLSSPVRYPAGLSRCLPARYVLSPAHSRGLRWTALSWRSAPPEAPWYRLC